MSIRCSKFDKSLELLEKEAVIFITLKDDPMLHRNWLCRMIVQLARGDLTAADTLYEEALTSSFATSDEQFAADQMLTAYDEADQDKLKEVTRQQIFSFLSNDIAVLARKLQAKGGTGRTTRKLEVFDPPPVASEAVPASSSTPPPADQVEDDETSALPTTEAIAEPATDGGDNTPSAKADDGDDEDDEDDLL